MPDNAELLKAADQFAQDLIANNIAGLMPVFTPIGMNQAMAMQTSGGGSAQGSSSYEVADQGEGRIHITFRGDDGDGTIFTQWIDVEGAWKVDGLGRVE